MSAGLSSGQGHRGRGHTAQVHLVRADAAQRPDGATACLLKLCWHVPNTRTVQAHLELDSGPVVPNPFNPTTQIIYGIPATAGRSRVVLDV